jgi:hypothetical protein
VKLGTDRVAASQLKKMARDLETSYPLEPENDQSWNFSARAEGRTLFYIYRSKGADC